MNERQNHIDLFRGIGIILMVMCHVGFGNSFYKFSHAFHMPMFFVIAGYFFAFPPFGNFIKKKAKTLLIPYAVFGILQYGMWLVLHRADSIQEKLLHLKSLLITNTDGNLVGGGTVVLNMPVFC